MKSFAVHFEICDKLVTLCLKLESVFQVHGLAK